MKRILFSLLAVFTAGAVNSQIIFSESFDGASGMATQGWTIINNDGLTPATNVAYVTDAWIIREDFVTPNLTDSIAVSTSWYTPAGTSDDWMISPAITLTGAAAILDWEAMAPDPNYADGYEVLISTTTPTIPAFTPIFSIVDEDDTWTPQSVDLSAYAGQTVYLAWRNNSTDEFLLFVDDIVVQVVPSIDAEMSYAGVEEYTMVPLAQVNNPLGTTGTITNVGGFDVTGVTMTVNVLDGTMANVYTATSTAVPTLTVGSNTVHNVAGYTPTTADLYTVQLISNITEIDANLANDTVTYTYFVTDSTYARDNSTLAGTLGIGAGNGGAIGQQYTLWNPDVLSSVSFFLVNSTGQLTDDSVVVTIYDMVGGLPNAVIAQTDTLALTDLVDSLYTMPIQGGPISLAAGDYVVAVNEGDSTLALGYTNEIVTPATTYITWPTSPLLPWATSEDFGFNVSYIIRPNFGACVPDAVTAPVSSCTDYTWTANGTTYTASGQYIEVLMNAVGCDSTVTLDLTINTVDNATTTAGNTFTATLAGGTYVWIDCATNTPVTGETSQSFTPTTAGDYAVIVSDGTCTDTSACVTSTVGLDEVTFVQGIEIYPNPSEGSFTIELSDLSTDMLTIEFTDAKGRVITSETLLNVAGDLTVPMHIENVEAGVYFVRFSSQNIQIVERVIITKK
ncbi:MAG: choice-of-anchor J domain-containing protein [Crocinitomicaceae bacterium]|nr:choice-of-anchor J domain-containing protein [Crocinitomicaceae bacterium]